MCSILILVQREETRYLMPTKPVDYETGSSYNSTESFYGIKCKILDHIQKLLKVKEYLIIFLIDFVLALLFLVFVDCQDFLGTKAQLNAVTRGGMSRQNLCRVR